MVGMFIVLPTGFQHTAARRRLRVALYCVLSSSSGFNTQPPEGGCQGNGQIINRTGRFQHTAARRRLHTQSQRSLKIVMFQHTAARRRLLFLTGSKSLRVVSFNTQPPEGGCQEREAVIEQQQRFNTQPPEGGCIFDWEQEPDGKEFQHTAARRRLLGNGDETSGDGWFQHTAARRRLQNAPTRRANNHKVSTHSRPKAAA